MKHNKQARQLGALTRFYRTHTSQFLGVLRKHGGGIFPTDSWTQRKAYELKALESSLPSEMVAWARINK